MQEMRVSSYIQELESCKTKPKMQEYKDETVILKREMQEGNASVFRD